ncbi:MAG: P-loop NTPase fold protein [bacterium]
MEQIKQIIENYLNENEVDYAILIDGKWGSGKTYYWKNFITDIINENKKSVYISLNGINDISEIGKKIFIDSNNITSGFNSKQLEFSNILYDIIKNKIGYEGNQINLENFIDLNKTVLCFDDLERCNIPIEEVLGYINNFVEHDGVKTIIIGHEKEIKNIFLKKNVELKFISALSLSNNGNESSPDISEVKNTITNIYDDYSYYDKIKEKLIGITISFNPTNEYLEEVLNNILENFNDKNYQSFINKNKDMVLDIFIEGEKNIRTLKYGLNRYYTIYTMLRGLDKTKANKYFIPFLKYMLSISFEFKSNNISADILKSFNVENYTIVGIFNSSQSINRNKESDKHLQDFFNKYYNGSTIDFISCEILVEYITTGYLDKIGFIEFMCQEFKEKEPASLDKLFNYWKLEDEEYEEVLDDVIKKITSGYYDLMAYPRIFAQLYRLFKYNLIENDLTELKEIFIKGINKAQNTSTYKEQLLDDVGVNEESMPEEFEDIKEIVLRKNYQLKFIADKQNIKHLLELMKKDQKKFIVLLKDYYDKDIKFTFFSQVDEDEFVDSLLDLRNEYILELSNIVKYGYRFIISERDYSLDYQALNNIFKKVKTYIEEYDGYTIKIYMLKGLVEVIEDILKRIDNNKD